MRTRTRAHVRFFSLFCMLCWGLGPFLRLRQRVAELRASSVKAGLEGGNRQVEGLADLLQGEVCVVVEEDRQAVSGVELGQGIEQGRVVVREGWVQARCLLLV